MEKTASAKLSDGQQVSGRVSFVAKTASEDTRTYPIEIHVANPDAAIPSGITAQISIPVQNVMAQKISPALLVLDDQGHMGVRTVTANDMVEFHEVSIINDEADGIWVTGLPEVTQVIIVGQQLVVAGERVNPTHNAVDIVSTGDTQGATL